MNAKPLHSDLVGGNDNLGKAEIPFKASKTYVDVEVPLKGSGKLFLKVPGTKILFL